MVGSSTEVIGQVVQEIDALQPNQVAGELAPFLEGKYLESMVVSEGVGRTLSAMRSVGDAIGRASDPEARTTLAKDAAGGLADIMLDDDFTPSSFESAQALVEQAGIYAGMIKGPEARADTFNKIAEGTMSLSWNYDSNDEVIELVSSARGFLDQAVEAAETIDDNPIARSYDLRKSAEVYVMVALGLVDSEEAVDQRVVEVYEKALEATDTIEDAQRRYHDRDNIVQSMARSAAEISESPGSAKLYESLLDLTLAKVDEELAGYESGGEEAGLSPWEKALNCVRLGGKLSEVIGKEYSAQQFGDARQKLVDRMMNVYRATFEHRRVAANSSDDDYSHYDNINFSNSPLEAAEKLLDSDLDAAKELLEIGFDLAVVHDGSDPVDKHKGEVLEKIRNYAERRTSVRSAFELFSLAYNQQLKTLSPGDRLFDNDEITYTVFRNLWYLSNAPDEEVALEEIDRKFLEFSVRRAVADADEPAYPRNNIEHIRGLARFVADPELKESINRQFEDLHTRDEAKRRPASKIAGLAYDHWSHS